jgi:3-oxoacyl-[acyl-carrier protein] reductase
MAENKVMLITGTRKGIGRALVEHYTDTGQHVVGCSRSPFEGNVPNYRHCCLDVRNESAVKEMFSAIKKREGRLDVLINNAGIASMNHSLTPVATVNKIMETNFTGTFLFCREAARLMQLHGYGRNVNFTSVAVPLKIEGEAAYAASKAAVISLTQMPEVAEVSVYGKKNAIMGQIPCAAIRLRQPRDQRQFHREFRQFCSQRLQEFQIPVRIRLVENEMYGERFKKNRREYA